MTTAEIIEAIRKPSAPPPEWLHDLRSAVEELCGKIDGRTLGYRFRHFARRNFGGRMLDKMNAPNGSNRWVVVSAKGREHPHHRNHHHSPTPSSRLRWWGWWGCSGAARKAIVIC